MQQPQLTEASTGSCQRITEGVVQQRLIMEKTVSNLTQDWIAVLEEEKKRNGINFTPLLGAYFLKVTFMDNVYQWIVRQHLNASALLRILEGEIGSVDKMESFFKSKGAKGTTNFLKSVAYKEFEGSEQQRESVMSLLHQHSATFPCQFCTEGEYCAKEICGRCLSLKGIYESVKKSYSLAVKESFHSVMVFKILMHLLIFS